VTEPAFTNDSIRAILVDLLDGWAHERGEGQGFSSKAHTAAVGTDPRRVRRGPELPERLTLVSFTPCDASVEVGVQLIAT